MSKKNRKKTNEEILASVFGPNYVSQYSETVSKSKKPETKQHSDVTRAPTRKKISAIPMSFSKEESKVSSNSKTLPMEAKKLPPKEKVSNIHKLDIPLPKKIFTATLGFSKSCEELSVDFHTKRISFKKDGIFYVFNFKGEELFNYVYSGKHITCN